ncbi:MAG: 23S rRNA pseudouridine(1911/1915/1917) synthase RluD [Candidatus Thiodiazotropha sp. (ex Monitilora ramsayi)]|nr:23S rRNA pseudouridine(1911/1915/1917) synthase RluD [Candidatus Thiodiazotropha sp. (ex Monitilora ramsayi)]
MTSDTELPPEVQPLELRVPELLAGVRLDQILAERFSDYSRSRIQRWVKMGYVLLDGQTCRAKDKVFGGEHLVIYPVQEDEVSDKPEAIALDILYEDDALLVVNKPAGMVVHPAAGNHSGTLLNGLLAHQPALAQIPRAGIVHRLDKETSGLLVVAKTLQAQNDLVQQLQARTVKREYRAVVQGVMTAGGRVDAPIARHPVNRLRMSVIETGKPAVTHYRVLQRFRAHTYLKINLETGRTHQIRVHMAHIHFPLVGDPLYGGRLKVPSGAGEDLVNALRGFRRQALHAMRLSLTHPESGDTMNWEASLPEDMQHLLKVLAEDNAG